MVSGKCLECVWKAFGRHQLRTDQLKIGQVGTGQIIVGTGRVGSGQVLIGQEHHDLKIK